MPTVGEYFNVTNEDIRKVRKLFGKDETTVKEDLKILNEWWSKQPHLPKNEDDSRLERMLLRNKYRVEQTKQKVDNYFTFHGLYSEMFEDFKTHQNEIFAQSKYVRIFLSPILSDSYERIIYCSIFKESKPDWKRLISTILLLQEVQLSYDYSIGDRIIVDFKNVTMNHYKNVSMEFNTVLKFATLYQEAYSGRLRGVEYINAPNYVDVFLQFFKMILKPKLFSKIKVHKSLSDLHKVIDPKYLPSDLGGELKSVEFYHSEMLDLFPVHVDEIMKNVGMKSDESLRIGKSFASQMFGVDGTFKKLNID